MKWKELTAPIVFTLKDFRVGEIEPINHDTVMTWVNQFGNLGATNEEMASILRQLHVLFSKYYHSKKKTKEFLTNIFTENGIFGQNPKEKILAMEFLEIQTKGSSQKDLLKIIDKILYRKFDFDTKDCGQEKFFFYIDDSIFSGNRFRYDIENWLETAPEDSKLVTHHLSMHMQGYFYANRKILQAISQRNIEVISWTNSQIDNRRSFDSPIESFWPSKLDIEDDFVNAYYQKIREKCLANNWSIPSFRPENVPRKETIFSNSEERKIIETFFLKAGARIVMQADSPAESMRPLGFEKLESFGFGSCFFSFRNTSNNCPLVLWYGDPDNYPPSHPLGMWRPLIPRKTNSM